jgi:hypothetical protein
MSSNPSNAQHLQYVLELDEACSGQKINKDKSSVLFSKNVKMQERGQVKQILQLSSDAKTDR